MARWLERMWTGEGRRALLQAFRGSGKSTLTGLFAAWALAREPELRILVLAANQPLAEAMVANTRRIVERHPLTRHLRSRRPEQWAADRFTVARRTILREPSMLAAGVESNITGARAELVICDDVEVPNTADTALKRINLRARLAEIDFILVPGGFVLYLGTPHAEDTIYRVAGADGRAAFLAGYEAMVLPVLDPAGESAWPERFPRRRIEAIARRTGPRRFKSQMMLEPVSPEDGHLDPGRLGRYGEELRLVEAQGQVELLLGQRRLVTASAWWDPSFGAADGDGSVLAVVFADGEGRLYLHDLVWLNRRQGAETASEDEAGRQCRAVIDVARRYHLPAVTVEINGIGRFLPGLLRRAAAEARAGFAVVEALARRSKHLRILEAWEVPLAAGAIAAHERVWLTPLADEMRAFQPRGGGHDDGLDAVAGALTQKPVRFGAVVNHGARPRWQTGVTPVRADSDFTP